jgi:hypothetical protein
MRTYCRAVLLLIASFAACSSPTGPSSEPPTPLAVPLGGEFWQTVSEPTPYPLTNQAGGLEFEFPSAGSINYLYTPSALAVLRGTLVATVRVTTTGPVLFNSLDPVTGSCSIPPSVRPFLWANENGDGSYDRWWSNPRAFALAEGAATIAVPLLPEFWSSVNGRFGNADEGTRFQFAKALLNVTRLGLTFGGGCSYGHGVRVQGGAAQFRLTEFAIR